MYHRLWLSIRWSRHFAKDGETVVKTAKIAKGVVLLGNTVVVHGSLDYGGRVSGQPVKVQDSFCVISDHIPKYVISGKPSIYI